MQKFIKLSLDYIEQNLKTDIKVEELANMTGYSVVHYCRLFNKIIGLSVVKYISKKRINCTLAAISSGQKAIDAVLEYGFDTYSGFYKAFVKMYGCSPTKYLTFYKNLTPEELEDILMDYNKIAEAALKIYSIKSKSIEFIEKSGEPEFGFHANTMDYKYKVIDKYNTIYCLYLHEFTNLGPKYDAETEKAIINSELEWVAAIGRDTDIIVPEPIKNIHGEYAASVADGVYCKLTKWFEGDSHKQHYLSFAGGEEGFDRYGDRAEGENWVKVIAKLHKYASEWTPPAGFVRPSYDVNNIIDIFTEIDDIKHDEADPKVEKYKRHAEIIKSAGQKAIERLKSNPIEKNNMTWGLIHSNLIHPAFQIFNRNVYPSCYSSTVFGYYMADIARAFFFVAPEKRQYFLDLYSKYFPLPKDCVSQIETLYIVRWLEILYYAMKTSNDYPPTDFDLLADKEFSYYLNDEPFLLNNDKIPFFYPPFPWDEE